MSTQGPNSVAVLRQRLESGNANNSTSSSFEHNDTQADAGLAKGVLTNGRNGQALTGQEFNLILLQQESELALARQRQAEERASLELIAQLLANDEDEFGSNDFSPL